MTRILVTGAAGRLGARVMAAAHGEPGLHVEALDLRDAAAVAALLAERAPDVVLHLAGVVPSSAGSADFEFNERSTRTIVEVAREAGIRRIVLASTAAVYGDAHVAPIAETTEPTPAGSYALSKLAAEAALSAADLETVALRIFNVYGPGFDDSLVARLARSTPESPASLRTLDDFTRDYVHADDVARALLAAATVELPGRHVTVNVGTGIPVTNRELLRFASIDHEVHAEVVDGPPSYSVADTQWCARVLGFVPPLRLGEALSR